MSKAVTRRGLEIFAVVRSIHGLQEEVLKVQSLELRRVRSDLRKDELQLAAFTLRERNACFGLTQIQSMPRGAGRVPLVSSATMKPRA